ncbi:phosphotransferase enzyme family protein [Ceratobasidium sp. AG-Ba]|nr:phosphotransferase enzyme family protein [Ceratobasidium sp. AG-Ba]
MDTVTHPESLIEGEQGSDAVSETSTIQYDHEPFADYQLRVRELLCDLYGSSTGALADIAHLPGRSFNRIIGVKILQSNVPKTLTLRVPRFDDSTVVDRVAMLRYLRPFIPVPEVEGYNTSGNNPLGEPYMLLHRLPGQNLYSVWDYLDTAQRCDIAKQVAQLISKILRVPLPLGIGPISCNANGELCIGRIPTTPPWPDETGTIQESNTTETWTHIPTTFSAYVHTRLAEFTTNAARSESGGGSMVDLYDRLLDVSRGLLDSFAHSGRVALFQRDFVPGNLLAQSSRQYGTRTIIGVLDWDGCEAAPYESATVWPSWLWHKGGETGAEFDKSDYDTDIPVTDGGSAQIKQVFLREIETLEPGFQDAVRRSRDCHLGSLYERARAGIWTNEDIKDVKRATEGAMKLIA